MTNKIKLLILPPHLSHFTQPLDIGIFSPLKEFMAQEIAPLVSTKIATVKKFEWLGAYIKSRAKAFVTKNVNGSWCGAGLVPFNPQKVLRRIKSKTPTPSSTPPPNENPFDKALSMLSPFNIPAVQSANAALSELITQGHPLNTPARSYVMRMIKIPEMFHARNTILEEEKSKAEGILSARRKAESGKRGILKGVHSVSNPELLEKIRAQEELTKKRKRKSGIDTTTLS